MSIKLSHPEQKGKSQHKLNSKRDMWHMIGWKEGTKQILPIFSNYKIKRC